MRTATLGNSVFVEVEFWLLVLFSFVLPIAIYALLLVKRAVSRNTVLVVGLMLVVIAGVDVYLLRSLSTMAEMSPSLADDTVFLSEVTLALYLLPAMFGGIGVNLLSHVLVRHLASAELQFEKEQRSARAAIAGGRPRNLTRHVEAEREGSRRA